MFIVAPDTVWNPSALETRSVPKRFIGRAMPIPRCGATIFFVLRWIFEMQALRYLTSLAPFVLAMLIWPDLALPIAQAPLVMLLVIGFVEMKVLTLDDDARARLIDADDADRALDLLSVRGRRALSAIAARHRLEAGELHLVIEHSEIARVAPLTLISVQSAMPQPRLLQLDAEDHREVRRILDADLTEEKLHLVSLARKAPLRQVTFDARGVSGHQRLAAALAARQVSA